MPVPVHSLACPSPLQLPLIPTELDRINVYLSQLPPQEILQWAVLHLPNLYQITAFGLTGLAATDMLSKINSTPPPLIFIDTLYHFPETLDLLREVKECYSAVINIFKPEHCDTVEAFESQHGERLWETNEHVYDYLVKVEPARRAYSILNVQSVITGRRASQGADRARLLPLEVDSTGLLKLNPFHAWSFAAVKQYIHDNHVPHNRLLERGYKSIGDWHSTVQSGHDEAEERSGRWKGKEKTECGLHKDYFAMKKLAIRKREEALKLKAHE